MLKVLIFVPAHTDSVDIHHELTTRLAQCLSGEVEVRLATSSDKNVSQAVTDYDIVHIFGCWSNSACLLANKAYRHRVPYIVTPLGGLQPWEMEHHRHTLLLQRQKNLVEKASAVHVCGKLEQETFAKVGWNKRVCQIKNPVLTSLATFDDTTRDLLALYRKALDSNARLLLRKDERRLIGRLLQAGIDDQAIKADDGSLAKDLAGLSEEAWRHILIYVADEKIDTPVKDALGRLGVEYPQIDVAAVDRFDNASPYPDGHLRDDTLLSRNILTRNNVKDVFSDNGREERRVCLALLNLHYELGRKAAPLLHLADLYSLLRFSDFDEDSVKSMAHGLNVDEFAERLMAIMADFLGLTEGFMPFTARNDRRARKLKRMITKFGVYK